MLRPTALCSAPLQRKKIHHKICMQKPWSERLSKEKNTYFSTIYIFHSSFSKEKVHEIALREWTDKVWC